MFEIEIEKSAGLVWKPSDVQEYGPPGISVKETKGEVIKAIQEEESKLSPDELFKRKFVNEPPEEEVVPEDEEQAIRSLLKEVDEYLKNDRAYMTKDRPSLKERAFHYKNFTIGLYDQIRKSRKTNLDIKFI